MTHPATVGVDKGSDLKTLNTILDQYERMLGPLISLGNDGNQTLMTFDTDPPAPNKSAVITVDTNGRSNVAAASSMVCQGTIFVAGALSHVTASRPT